MGHLAPEGRSYEPSWLAWPLNPDSMGLLFVGEGDTATCSAHKAQVSWNLVTHQGAC